jgi:hypothetical protein
MRKVQVNQEGVKLNRAYLLLVYVDDVNLLGENINITKKNKEALLAASKEGGQEVTAEKSIC